MFLAANIKAYASQGGEAETTNLQEAYPHQPAGDLPKQTEKERQGLLEIYRKEIWLLELQPKHQQHKMEA